MGSMYTWLDSEQDHFGKAKPTDTGILSLTNQKLEQNESKKKEEKSKKFKTGLKFFFVK